MDIPIHLLPTFLELAESLNISHTAKKLKISQPAVSRQLQALEYNLQVTLFLRKSRGMTLTVAGRHLKTQLQKPYDTMIECLSILRKDTTAISGSIVIGSLTEVGKSRLMPLLLEFASFHTTIKLDVRLMSGRLIPQELVDGQLGLGLVTSKPKDNSLQVHHLFSERIVAITSSKNKIDLEQNNAPQFVANSSQDPLLQSYLRKHFQRSLVADTNIVVSVNAHRSMLDAVEKMALYAVMPIHSVEEALSRGKVRLASKKELKNEIYLAFRKNAFLERRYQELVDFLVHKTREQDQRQSPPQWTK